MHERSSGLHMGLRGAVALAALLAAAAPGAAAPKVAVFEFELLDTSLEGELQGPRADEQWRLSRLADTLREALAASGRYEVVDITPVGAEARSKNLHTCGRCDAQLAAAVGAELAITGTVQKVSNLILNMNIYVRDVRSSNLIRQMSADFRGNTDESWSRALDWLVRNRLLEDEGGPKP
jgi:Protein of unknown function (DUF2380)